MDTYHLCRFMDLETQCFKHPPLQSHLILLKVGQKSRKLCCLLPMSPLHKMLSADIGRKSQHGNPEKNPTTLGKISLWMQMWAKPFISSCFFFSCEIAIAPCSCARAIKQGQVSAGAHGPGNTRKARLGPPNLPMHTCGIQANPTSSVPQFPPTCPPKIQLQRTALIFRLEIREM